MNAKLSKLLTAAKKASGFAGRYRWEVALVCEKTNLNYPFRPENYDHWAGDMARLYDCRVYIRPGIYLECWIYEPGSDGELVDNVYIWIDSETSARVRVCGEQVKAVSIKTCHTCGAPVGDKDTSCGKCLSIDCES